jgi:hypothetical protein
MDERIEQRQPRTLMQAHSELVRIRPSRNAPLATWLAYYQHSVSVYEQIAQTTLPTTVKPCTGRNASEPEVKTLPRG